MRGAGNSNLGCDLHPDSSSDLECGLVLGLGVRTRTRACTWFDDSQLGSCHHELLRFFGARGSVLRVEEGRVTRGVPQRVGVGLEIMSDKAAE